MISEDAKKSGYTKLRVNGSFVNVDEDFTLEKNKKDNIDIVIDKLTVASDERSRIFEDIEASCKMANGKVVFLIDEEEIVAAISKLIKEAEAENELTIN